MQPVDLSSSPDDSRGYRLFRHDSGLHCLLISDPAASQATAVLQVDAGSHDEPSEWPGLAHLLEHMLFMGCAAHPEPGTFARIIDYWGGRFNASTAPESTAFFFSVSPEGLRPCVLQLAEMLASPLFDPQRVEAERRVIDAEFHTRLGDDALHRQAALGQLFNPDHPLSRFTIGNAETLKGNPEALADELRSLHSGRYRLAAMSLVLHAPVSPEGLEKLASEVTARLADTPHAREARPVRQLPALFQPGTLPVCLRWRCLSAAASWELLVPLPPLDSEGARAAAFWLCDWLNDPSPAGALGGLRELQLVDELRAQVESFADQQTLLLIRMQPIVAGGKKPDREALLQALVNWFAGLAALDPAYFPMTARQRLADLGFAQGPQGEPIHWCRRFAEHLLRWPAARVLVGSARPDRFDVASWRAMLGELQSTSWILAIGDPRLHSDHQCSFTRTPWSIEPWPVLKPALTASRVQLPLLPHLSARPVEPTGALLPGFRRRFVPGAQNRVRLGWCLPGHTPLELLHRQRVTCELAGEKLFHWPRQAGLEVRWAVGPGLLWLDAQGPEPVLSGAIEQLISTLDSSTDVRCADSERRWLRWQAERRDALPAYRLLDALEHYLSLEGDTGAAMPDISPKTAQLVCVQAGAIQLHGLLHPALGQNYPSVTRPFAWQCPAPRKLGSGQQLLEVNCRHADRARILYLQGNGSSAEVRAGWRLIHRLIAAPFFDELRTRQQLGYWVVARYHSLAGVPGMLLLVQSPDQDQTRLAQSMDDFLLQQHERLTRIDFSEVQQQARQVAATLRAQSASPDAVLERVWQECLGTEDEDLGAEAQVLDHVCPQLWQVLLDAVLLESPRLALHSMQPQTSFQGSDW